MAKRLHKALITGLGTGYLPLAPGTWGSAVVCGLYLAAVALAYWIAVPQVAAELDVSSPAQSERIATMIVFPLVGCIMLLVTVLSTVGCVALGRQTEEAFGRKDPGKCTLDEFAGQALALAFLPLGAVWIDWVVAAGVGFFYFRLFDIIKLPPARRLERLPRGWGVVLDDISAGIYANLAAQISLNWCYFGWCPI